MNKIQDYIREEMKMIEALVKDLKYKIVIDYETDDILLKLIYKTPKKRINRIFHDGIGDLVVYNMNTREIKGRILRIIPDENINFFTKYILSWLEKNIEIFKLENK